MLRKRWHGETRNMGQLIVRHSQFFSFLLFLSIKVYKADAESQTHFSGHTFDDVGYDEPRFSHQSSVLGFFCLYATFTKRYRFNNVWLLDRKEEERKLTMGYNRSWISRNESEHAFYQAVTRALEIRNVSTAEIGQNNRSSSGIGALENRVYSEEQTYRHFTTTVQIVIFIGSLLGK